MLKTTGEANKNDNPAPMSINQAWHVDRSSYELLSIFLPYQKTLNCGHWGPSSIVPSNDPMSTKLCRTCSQTLTAAHMCPLEGLSLHRDHFRAPCDVHLAAN